MTEKAKGTSTRNAGATPQLDGARAHAAHLRMQRDTVLAKTHGTAKSRRGVRIRVNPEIPRRERAGDGVTRGGRYRG